MKDELTKLLENAGVPVTESEAQDSLFANFEAELDELLSKAESQIDEIVDAGEHEGFRMSLKHQLKKMTQEKLYQWTKGKVEWLKRLPPEEGGDLPPTADPTGTLKRDIAGNIGPTK